MKCALLLCALAVALAAEIPPIKWGQSRQELFLDIAVNCDAGTRNAAVDDKDNFKFSCKAGGKEYKVDLILRGEITNTTCVHTGRSTEHCTLKKKNNGHLFDRLTQSLAATNAMGKKLSININQWEKDESEGHVYTTKIVHSVSSDAEFKQIIAKHPVVVADVTPKWCTSCTSYQKKVMQAARNLKSKAYFVALDTLEARESRREYDASCSGECEMLRVFYHGEKPTTVKVDHNELEPVLELFFSPLLTEITTQADLKAFQNGTYTQTLGVFPSKTDSNFKKFQEVASKLRSKDKLFAVHITPSTGSEVLGVSGSLSPSVVVFDSGKPEVLKGDMGGISDFIKTRTVPAFQDYSYERQNSLASVKLDGPKQLVYAQYFSKEPLPDNSHKKPEDWNDEDDGEWSPEPHVPHEIVELARKYRGRLVFMRVPDNQKWLMNKFYFDDEEAMPAFGLSETFEQDYDGIKPRYALKEQGEKLTAELMEKFIEDYLAGKLQPVVKSESVPSGELTSSVNKVVRKNIHKVAMDSGDDILVHLFKSGPEDDKIAKMLEKLVVSLSTVDNMFVTKMDTAKNSPPKDLFGSEEHGLFLFSKGEGQEKKTITQYKGKVAQKNLLVWLKANSGQVAKQWEAVKEQTKKIKTEEDEKKAAAKAEKERLAAIPKEDISKDGGILKQILAEGEADSGTPPNGAQVSAHYVGTLQSNGDKFDSSRDRGSPFSFKLGTGGVIKCWDQAFATMKKGEKALLTCRSDYAYGDSGSGSKIPGGATLLFEVELLSWEEDKKPEL